MAPNPGQSVQGLGVLGSATHVDFAAGYRLVIFLALRFFQDLQAPVMTTIPSRNTPIPPIACIIDCNIASKLLAFALKSV